MHNISMGNNVSSAFYLALNKRNVRAPRTDLFKNVWHSKDKSEAKSAKVC